MTTYCVLCRAEIPQARQKRGAVSCSPEHAKEYRRQRRAERALRNCRLCGRRARKVKVQPMTPDNPLNGLETPVLTGHSDLIGPVTR
jgi:hypothetical protein